MYNVRLLLDRAGAIVERYAYDSYGRPRIRESCGRGDMNDDTKLSSTDTTRFTAAKNATIWDPRADMDDDGDVDSNDQTLYDNKYSDWSGAGPPVDPRQAFSDKGNPFMFQGIPHFALDTAADADDGKLMLNYHRARFADPVTGRWITRDPLWYLPLPSIASASSPNSAFGEYAISKSLFSERIEEPLDLYRYLSINPNSALDPSGLNECFDSCRDGGAQLACDSPAYSGCENHCKSVNYWSCACVCDLRNCMDYPCDHLTVVLNDFWTCIDPGHTRE